MWNHLLLQLLPQDYAQISHNKLCNFQNVNIALARGKKPTFILFWSPSRWIFSNGNKTNMSCFYELFAKRLLKFCKYFFLNDIFLSFIDIMSTVSLQNMLCGLNILCVKLHMFCIFSKGISPRQSRPPYFLHAKQYGGNNAELQ